MKNVFLSLIILVTSSAAQASVCSYLVEDTSVWDYAPGTLTLDGVQYKCEKSLEYGVQACLQAGETSPTVFTAVIDDNTFVIVFANPKDVKGSKICQGPATVK